ncbi:hypothetical protein GCM10028833_38690 [Glycomyces tarimensis]
MSYRCGECDIIGGTHLRTGENRGGRVEECSATRPNSDLFHRRTVAEWIASETDSGLSQILDSCFSEEMGT